MDAEEIRSRLIALSEPAYRAFNSSLLPGVENMLGVRLPALRKIAQEIIREDWRGYLAQAQDGFYEEIMLQGLVIGLAKAQVLETFGYVERFLPKITNWAVCDSFCGSLKVAQRAPEQVWGFLQPYFASEEAFDVRFSVVMTLNYYLDEGHFQQALALLDRIKHENYYVKMAVAWAISIAFVRNPQRTMDYLRCNSLDAFTYRKALSKILESYRVTPEDKNAVRALRGKTIVH